MSKMVDFASLNLRLLGRSTAILSEWFPAGKVRGNRFLVGGFDGKAGESLSIDIHTGQWAEFAGTERGGDLISLRAAMLKCSQLDAARNIEPDTELVKAKTIVQLPVPDDAPACTWMDRSHGEPSAVWAYKDINGKLNGYDARYDPPGGKKKLVKPWAYADGRWQQLGLPSKSPLFGLEELKSRPNASVLVVEGCKCVVAARTVALSYIVMTWQGGANSWQKADWSVLKGRKVLLWPDCDSPGIDAMWNIGNLLLKYSPEIKIILPTGHPDGWDVADATASGMTWADIKAWASPLIQPVTEPHAPPLHAEPPATTNGSGHLPEAATTEPPAQTRWVEWNLDRNSQGMPHPNLNNAVTILERDPMLKGRVWFDVFLNRMLTTGTDGPREWTDADVINLAIDIQRRHRITRMGVDTAKSAVLGVAKKNVRNCVKDWLDTLKWDGVARIDHFFEDNFGAEGTNYVRAASKNFWLSMTARVYDPGCKVDNMIIIEGPQGVGKSLALRTIAGEWFAEQHESATNPKAFLEIIQGVLLTEISEMDAFSRAEVSRVKQIISSQIDRYRDSYGYYATAHKRQGIFVGTTNTDDWNRDDTGARRFWPIRARGTVDIANIKENRLQYFAEAVQRTRGHEPWWIMPREETEKEQADRFVSDIWQDDVEVYLAGRPETVTVGDIFEECLKITIGHRTKRDEMRVASVLRHVGWIKDLVRSGGKVSRVWRREADIPQKGLWK